MRDADGDVADGDHGTLRPGRRAEPTLELAAGDLAHVPLVHPTAVRVEGRDHFEVLALATHHAGALPQHELGDLFGTERGSGEKRGDRHTGQHGGHFVALA